MSELDSDKHKNRSPKLFLIPTILFCSVTVFSVTGCVLDYAVDDAEIDNTDGTTAGQSTDNEDSELDDTEAHSDTEVTNGSDLTDEDECPDDPNKEHPGVCGCGVPDDDSDEDGTLNCDDECPDDPNKDHPGACGCGAPDIDSDSDGTPNCDDKCPYDPQKTEPGQCGCDSPEGNCDTDESVPQYLTITPEADAYVDSSNPLSNYGYSSQLFIDDFPDSLVTILRFKIPTLTAPLERATIWLFSTDPAPLGPGVYLTDNNWTEGGVTYSNCPGPKGNAIAQLGEISTGWLEIDVTGAISGSGAYSFLLIPRDRNGSDFHSKEGSNKPQLVVITN